MPSNEAFEQTHSATTENGEGGLIAALLTTAPSLLNRYHDQLLAMRDTFRLELVLNLKCGILVLCLSVVLACVMFSAWVGLNTLFYFGLTAIDAPAWSIALAIVTVHIVALWALYRAIRIVFAEMGFNQILDALGAPAPTDEDDAS